MDTTVKLVVNGRKRSVITDAGRSLLDVLREDLGLTGTKYGCGEGQCGACSVLVDGIRVRSCVTPVGSADKRSIVTIEGLSRNSEPHPVQESFLEEGAVQCGYCTGGMIVTAVALLAKNVEPTAREISTAMNGNMCRCNGYPKVVRAIRRAAEKMKG